MILVIGATGTNGREVVDRLSAKGERVRALVRDPAKASGLAGSNVELVRGDLDDPASLAAAFDGTDRAFFLASVDRRYTSWFGNFLDAALASGNPRIVKFSGLGASVDSPSELMRQHGETDERLVASGLPYTILRPNSFYQNLLWAAGTIRDQGAFYLPIGDARQSLVDVRDIASVAAEILTHSGRDGQIHEITGPESLTYSDIAATLSTALGRPVRYVAVPPEAAYDSMIQSGMPEWNARAVTDLYGVFAAGQAAATTDTIERLTGRAPIRFEQFARDHAEVFR